MKKIFGVFLCVMFCTALVWAQEEEESSSMFEPSITIENETTFKTVKMGEDGEKGNIELAKEEAIGNESSAEFAVGIKLGETFSLNPYVKDKLAIMHETAFSFDANDFAIGLGMTYAPMDMLEITAGLGYLNRHKRGEVDIPGGSKISFFAYNGLEFNVGLGLNVESIFLEAGIENSLEWVQGKKRYGADDKQYGTNAKLSNTFTVEMKMDFFNFIKEKLNSGLVLGNELKFEQTKTRSAEFTENWQWIGDKTIENEFSIGLHFAPVEFMDFTFLIKDAFEKKVEWEPSGSDAKYSDDYESSNKVLLGLGLEFKKNMFKFGIEYTPQLSGTETKKEGDNVKTDPMKDMEHEVKLVVGIEL